MDEETTCSFRKLHVVCSLEITTSELRNNTKIIFLAFKMSFSELENKLKTNVKYDIFSPFSA